MLMMRGDRTRVALVVVVGLAWSGAARASSVINGGFESGLTGWSAIGDVSTVGAPFGSGPIAGSSNALLTNHGDFSGGDAVSDASLEAFLGLGSGDLDVLANSIDGDLPDAIEGSAIRQTFTAAAGDTISFDFNFITTEQTTGANDFAFVCLTVDGVLAVLVDTTHSSFFISGASLPVDGFEQRTEHETGVLGFSHTLATGGAVGLGIGIVDNSDELVTSGLLVDSVSVTPVPVPAAAWGGLALIGGIAGVARLRRKLHRR
jgi:hypothetical protein